MTENHIPTLSPIRWMKRKSFFCVENLDDESTAIKGWIKRGAISGWEIEIRCYRVQTYITAYRDTKREAVDLVRDLLMLLPENERPAND